MKNLILFVLFSQALTFSQDLYQLNLKGYPLTFPDCSKAAEEVAQAFTKATGATITGKKCRTNLYSHDIDLFYASEKPLLLHTAGNWSIYPSQKHCEEQFQKEKQFFEESTGLSPFLSFCALDADPESSADGYHRFTPVFWALGNPRAVLKTFYFTLFEGRFSGDRTDIEEILQKSRAKGLPLLEVFFDERKYQSRLLMRFLFPAHQEPKDISREYDLKSQIENPFSGNSDFDIYGDPMLSWTQEQCEVQKQLAQPIFHSYFGAPVVWFCMEDTLMSQFRLYHLIIKPGQNKFAKIIPGKDGEPFANEYDSHEACLKDLSHLISYYEKKESHPIIGGLCSWGTSSTSHEKSSAFLYFKE